MIIHLFNDVFIHSFIHSRNLYSASYGSNLTMCQTQQVICAVLEAYYLRRWPIYYVGQQNVHNAVEAPVLCSWQGIDRSVVASARAVNIIFIYNHTITTFDCQGGGIWGRP